MYGEKITGKLQKAVLGDKNRISYPPFQNILFILDNVSKWKIPAAAEKLLKTYLKQVFSAYINHPSIPLSSNCPNLLIKEGKEFRWIHFMNRGWIILGNKEIQLSGEAVQELHSELNCLRIEEEFPPLNGSVVSMSSGEEGGEVKQLELLSDKIDWSDAAVICPGNKTNKAFFEYINGEGISQFRQLTLLNNDNLDVLTLYGVQLKKLKLTGLPVLSDVKLVNAFVDEVEVINCPQLPKTCLEEQRKEILSLLKIDFCRNEGNSDFLFGNSGEDSSPKMKQYHHHFLNPVKISLSPFYMSSSLVSKGLFDSIMEPEQGDVTSSDWFIPAGVKLLDAMQFCNRLSQTHGLSIYYTLADDYYSINTEADGFRLPSEAQWEYAAKNGRDFLRYPIADPAETVTPLDGRYNAKTKLGVTTYSFEHADLEWDSSSYRFAFETSNLINESNQYPPTESGYFDMICGEWCSDLYSESMVCNDGDINPVCLESNFKNKQVVKGTNVFTSSITVYNRWYGQYNNSYHDDSLCFRLVLPETGWNRANESL